MNALRAFKTLLTILLSLMVCFITAEIALRLIPIPGIEFENATYDDLIGVGFYPLSYQIYTNKQGDYVKRRVNRWGYMDADHRKDKADGVFRIGFFGDSYTEARQVPLESTFSRIIERNLEKYNIETLAFGIMGIGTLHEYLLCKRECEGFSLDMVVYVFFDNDPRDNFKTEEEDSTLMPYSILKPDGGFSIDDTFRLHNRFRQDWYYKAYDYALAHSLLLSTVRIRLGLLFRHGIKMNVTEQERTMQSKFNKVEGSRKLPDKDALVSTWPVEVKDYAERLSESIILKWKEEVESRSKRFVVLYVPRYVEWRKPTYLQDSWKPWLEKFCLEKEIDFIDPYEELLDSERNGEEILYDHLTISGHNAFAKGFINWFEARRRSLLAKRDGH